MLRVLSNVNVEPLKTEFRGETISFAGFNQIEREIIDRESLLYSPAVTDALVFLDAESLLKEHLYALPDADCREQMLAEFRFLLSLIEQFSQSCPRVLVFVNTLALPPRTVLAGLAIKSGPWFQSLEHDLNSEVYSLARRRPNVLIIDWRLVVMEQGYANLIDDRYWYLGRVRLNKLAFQLIAREFKRLKRTYTSPAKKVLILDLDNTLWGGILDEVGSSGILLGEDGIGKAYREFQLVIKGLMSLGVLLAIASKNNEMDVITAFEEHPFLLLRLDDFAAKRINWNSKPQNIVEIAEELGVGLDSMVFVDDNPLERDLVKTTIPDVAVPDFPKEPALMKQWALATLVPDYFQRLSITQEDRDKAQQYRAKAARADFALHMSTEEYIRTLGIQLRVYRQAKDQQQRITQLLQKTNQFNLSLRRFTESEIHDLLNAPDADVFTLDYADRFGKEGIVAAATIRHQGSEALIDSMVMSCRVIGRNVEFYFLLAIIEDLMCRHVLRVRAEFMSTRKNSAFTSFYSTAGFEEYGLNHYGKDCAAIYSTLSHLIKRWGAQDLCTMME